MRDIVVYGILSALFYVSMIPLAKYVVTGWTTALAVALFGYYAFKHIVIDLMDKEIEEGNN